jgi:hypothetical protein
MRKQGRRQRRFLVKSVTVSRTLYKLTILRNLKVTKGKHDFGRARRNLQAEAAFLNGAEAPRVDANHAELQFPYAGTQS